MSTSRVSVYLKKACKRRSRDLQEPLPPPPPFPLATPLSSIHITNRLLGSRTTRNFKALAKRSQDFSTSYPNIAGPVVCKLRPNEHNIPTQHCWARHVGKFDHPVATFWVFKMELGRMPECNIVARTCPNDYNIMQHPQMLHEKYDHFQIWANNTRHVVTWWPNARNILCPTMLRYAALSCCYRLTGA